MKLPIDTRRKQVFFLPYINSIIELYFRNICLWYIHLYMYVFLHFTILGSHITIRKLTTGDGALLDPTDIVQDVVSDNQQIKAVTEGTFLYQLCK